MFFSSPEKILTDTLSRLLNAGKIFDFTSVKTLTGEPVKVFAKVIENDYL